MRNNVVSNENHENEDNLATREKNIFLQHIKKFIDGKCIFLHILNFLLVEITQIHMFGEMNIYLLPLNLKIITVYTT